MSNFSFSLNESQVSSNVFNYFKPYTINPINSIKAEFVNGTSAEGKDWKALDITFSGKEGQHRERFFIPSTDEEGMKRGQYETSNGGVNVTPSSYEILKQLAIHTLGIYAPAQFEKFKAFCAKVKNMEQFLQGFVKLLNDAPLKETFVKVVGRNSNGTVYARLPRPCNVSKDKQGNYTDETYPVNFLGKNLTFTTYEIGQKNALETAKPTEMKDDPIAAIDQVSSDDDELDFDALAKL